MQRSRRESAVAIFLRHMERGRFPEALKALRKCGDAPPPPPHALWRIARWFLDKGRPKQARAPLQRFLKLYPAHLDRPNVMRDLALALALTGRKREAEELAAEAESAGRVRADTRQNERMHQVLMAGRAQQFALNRR